MKIIYFTATLTLVAYFSLRLTSCSKEKVPLPPLDTTCADSIRFQSFVLPLMQTNCSTSGCHDAFASGGYTLETHSQISSNSAIILKAIRHESGTVSMPQDLPKLADSLATKFNCWILQGKLNN